MPLLLVYMLIFVAVGAGFVLVNLIVGMLVRPAKMNREKGTIYECGEPTVGSAWVQFDLRYYVVALLFIIFDVEVAFFFPWATVYGKLNALADPSLPNQERAEITAALSPAPPDPAPVPPPAEASDAVKKSYEARKKAWDERREPWENEQKALAKGDERVVRNNREGALTMAWIAFIDILVFFAVLLIGYAYLWKRGDIDWVRSTAAERAQQEATPRPAVEKPTRELVGV